MLTNTVSTQNSKTGHHLSAQFLILWFGQLASNIGNGLSAFALGIYVFQITGSASSYSLVLLAAFLPSLLLKPIGGTLADRLNRRVLMIIGDLGSAAGLLFILVMMYLGIEQLWVFYLGTIISSIFSAFQNPAYKASVTDLVHEQHYSKASGLMQLAESSKFMISPLIAGLLLKIFDIKTILIIDSFTYLIAISATAWITTQRNEVKQSTEHQHFFRDFTEGFLYIFRNKGIFWLLSIISLVTFFIGLFQALLGPMLLSFTNSQYFGTSVSISTLGMLLGSCFIGFFGKFSKKLPVLSISLIFNGIFFSLIGISTNIILITLFGFLFFLVLPFVNTSLDVLVRCNVANNIQGRIWGIVSLISQLGMAIAFGIGGYLADNIFNPLLEADGALASSLGTLIGTGAGRGIGLMFIVSGLFVSMIAIIIGRLTTLKALDGAPT